MSGEAGFILTGGIRLVNQKGYDTRLPAAGVPAEKTDFEKTADEPCPCHLQPVYEQGLSGSRGDKEVKRRLWEPRYSVYAVR